MPVHAAHLAIADIAISLSLDIHIRVCEPRKQKAGYSSKPVSGLMMQTSQPRYAATVFRACRSLTFLMQF